MILLINCYDSKHGLRLRKGRRPCWETNKNSFEWNKFSKGKKAMRNFLASSKSCAKRQPVLFFYEEKTKKWTDALDAAFKTAKSRFAIIEDGYSLNQANLISSEIENYVLLIV